jgi:HEAT repeat protein
LIRVSNVRAETGLSKNVREAVLAELQNSLDDSDPTVVQVVLDVLSALRDSSVISKAAVISHSDDVLVAAHALMYRFTVGDIKGLQDAVNLIEKKSDLMKGEKDALAWSIASQEAQVPILDLNRLLIDSSYPTLRTVAATVLSERGDRTSIPALITGLSDPNRETQYRCIVGLSRITGRPGPGYKEFMSDPKSTLADWKRWSKGKMSEK